MIHIMKLDSVPFMATKLGLKLIEVRLNDEKRRQIRKGDTIEFENTDSLEKINVQVKDIRKYESIAKLVASENFGKTGGIYLDQIHWLAAIENYYSKADREKYGLLAIEIVVSKV